jgi:hypothetical protein
MLSTEDGYESLGTVLKNSLGTMSFSEPSLLAQTVPNFPAHPTHSTKKSVDAEDFCAIIVMHVFAGDKKYSGKQQSSAYKI